jgi:hypothetical protein
MFMLFRLKNILLVVLFWGKMGFSQVKITVDGSKIINVMKGGMGATFYPMNDSIPVTEKQSYGGSTWGGVPDSQDEAAWQQIYQHLNWLGFDWCRVEIEHRMFEPEKGVFTWQQYEMKNMYRFLDYCEKNKVDVFFQERYPNVKWLTPKSWQNDAILKVLSAPSDIDAWANGMVRLMDYLVNEKKYSCIKYLCIANEPEASWSWWKQYPDTSSVSITPALALLKNKLAVAKINIPLSGPDWSLDVYQPNRKMDFNASVGAYDLHVYNAKPDWWTQPFQWKLGMMRMHERVIKAYVDTAHNEGKPFYLTEFGSFYQGFDKTSEMVTNYYSVLKDVQTVVRFSNLGVDGFNKWSFINRGDLDGQWQFINTWDTGLHKILPVFTPHKNQYFLYGLLTRLTPKYATVLDTKVSNGHIGYHQRLYATTYKSNNKNYSIVLVNDYDKPFEGTLELNNVFIGKPLYKYEITEANKDSEHVVIKPVVFINTYLPKGQGYKITVAPNSLQILSTYLLQPNDKGIITDEAIKKTVVK